MSSQWLPAATVIIRIQCRISWMVFHKVGCQRHVTWLQRTNQALENKSMCVVSSDWHIRSPIGPKNSTANFEIVHDQSTKYKQPRYLQNCQVKTWTSFLSVNKMAMARNQSTPMLNYLLQKHKDTKRRHWFWHGVKVNNWIWCTIIIISDYCE